MSDRAARAAAPPCRLCGGRAPAVLTATDRNRAVDERRFVYARCEACATLQLAEPQADLAHYYGAEYHGVPTPEQLRP